MSIKSEQLSKTIKEYDENRIVIKELKERDIIKEYVTYVSQNEKLSLVIDMLITEVQSECNHEAWYHISTSHDDYEGRSYYNCKCLDCDHVEEDRTRAFKNVIYTKKNFRDVQIKYKELKEITTNPKIILELLEERFERK